MTDIKCPSCFYYNRHKMSVQDFLGVFMIFPTENLKLLRKSKNIMLKDMAEILSLSPRNYQRYEKGEVDIPLSKLLFLANYYDVSIDYLVGRTNNPNSHKT